MMVRAASLVSALALCLALLPASAAASHVQCGDAITQDTTFASRVAHRTLELQPATGELKPKRKGWFG